MRPVRWYIASVHEVLASNRFEKLVAARRCVVDLPKPVDETAFMARLAAAYPETTQFAFMRDESCFLGVSSETLYVRGDDPAVATGTGIVVIALVGAVIASAALLSVPRPATRFALAT